MFKYHPEFKIEKTLGLPLWRYMDFWKFLQLVSTSKLFFPNVEMLGDDHEGRVPEKIYQLMLEEEKKDSTIPLSIDNYKKLLDRLRKETLICSWIANRKESFAMWKMYAKDKLGIAIKTDYDRLRQSFNKTTEDIYIGEVSYYDNDKPYYRLGNTFTSFLIKHNYYDFESEVRCISELTTNDTKIFKNIDVDLNMLIDKVYISPFAIETGFQELIEHLKFKHCLSFSIETSGVKDKWL